MKIKAKPVRKAQRPEDAIRLTDIINIGPALAADLELIGIHNPIDLKGRDPFQLYHDLCTVTAARHDPCVIDAFISAVRFMDGKGARVWWDYTAERKRVMAAG